MSFLVLDALCLELHLPDKEPIYTFVDVLLKMKQ